MAPKPASRPAVKATLAASPGVKADNGDAADVSAMQHQLHMQTRAAHEAKEHAEGWQQRYQDSEAALAREKMLLREVTGGLRKRCKELEDEAWQRQKEHDADCAALHERIKTLEGRLSAAHELQEQAQADHAQTVCS